MSNHRARKAMLRWRVTIGAAVMLVTGLGIAPSPTASAAPVASPTGYLDCGIIGKITVSPRLQTAAAGGVSQVKVSATLTDCNGPFSYNGVPTGPAIHSGLLTVAGTGTLDPIGPATDCSAAKLVWQPSAAWQILWKAGPNGTGQQLGKTLIRGMTMDTNFLPNYPIPNLLAAGVVNYSGETDAVTNEPASWTGAFGQQSAFLIGYSGITPVVADTNLCGTAAGLRTLTFSGPTGDPRSNPPPLPAVRIDL
jgi:hypothetical protein